MTTLRTHTAAPATSRNKLLWIAGMGWTFDAMDVGLLAFLLAALQADWGLSAAQLGWIGSLNAAGMAVGAFVFGLMADRKGRKPVFILTLLLFSLGSGLTAVAGSLAVVLVLRFFIGMGLGGELPVASTLVSESVAPHERGRVVVLLESFWAVGWLIAALIAYYVIPDYGWRTAMLLSALPALYALWLRAKLPEPVSRYTAQERPKLTIAQSMALIWSPQYRRATLMLWILWFCVVFSYYGIFLWLPGLSSVTAENSCWSPISPEQQSVLTGSVARKPPQHWSFQGCCSHSLTSVPGARSTPTRRSSIRTVSAPPVPVPPPQSGG